MGPLAASIADAWKDLDPIKSPNYDSAGNVPVAPDLYSPLIRSFVTAVGSWQGILRADGLLMSANPTPELRYFE
jgi:hypothetical protein